MRVLSLIFLPILLATGPVLAGDNVMGSITLTFAPDATFLNARQRNVIDQALQQLAYGDVELDVNMAVWADQDFPGVKNSLSEEQQELAEERIESIEEYLEDQRIEIDDMDAYNMAHGSNWFARVFNMADFKTAITEGTDDRLLEERKYRIFKEEGGPSKAVVVLALDD